MSIWSAEIKELEKLYESLKGQLPALEKELEPLTRIDDANVIMLYSRRTMEVIITDLCEYELKRPRGTEPLKGIIDKLHKERKVPDHISTSMHGLNDLSTYGTHPKDFDLEQVKPVLVNLDIIIKWYLKYKEIWTDFKTQPAEVVTRDIKSTETAKKSFLAPKKGFIGLVSGLLLISAILAAIMFLRREPEKSIAVLPFNNDSQSDSTTHFINGLKDEILNNLQTIKEFRVLSRTSTDQFQGKERPAITEIAKKLGVNYIVEGSGQKYGNNLRLRVQLFKAKGKEKQLWGKSFQQEIRMTTDLFSIQSQIAQTIAKELKATITPEEKQLIEKVPTTNQAAWNFYQMGRDEEGKFPYYDLIISSTIAAGVNPSTRQSLERAEKMYKTAIKFDSTLALAYTGLAGIYWGKNYFREYFSEYFMDSAFILAEKALSFDDQLPDAYFIRGMCFSENSKYKQAHEDFDKTLKLNPNYWQAYFAKGIIEDNYEMAVRDYHKAASRHQGPGLSEILNRISFNLSLTGFSELAKKYSLESVRLESDSTKYYFWIWMYEFDYNNTFPFFLNEYSIDSTNLTALQFLSSFYCYSGHFKEAIKFFKKRLARDKAEDRTTFNEMQRVGYVYSKIGFKDSAEYYFNKQIEYCNDAVRLDRSSYSTAYYDLAGVYAYLGDKIKAYEYLKIYNQKPKINLWVRKFIRLDPLFDNIRDEPEFQNIVKEMDAKYQAEHDRVGKWLEEKGML